MDTEPCLEIPIICQNDASQILLVCEQATFSLPTVTVTEKQRIVPQIVEIMNRQWGIQGIVLFSFKPHESGSSYHLVEMLYGEVSSMLQWVEPHLLSQECFKSKSDYTGLKQGLALADSYRLGTLPGPFARIGWLNELTPRLTQLLSAGAVKLTGNFEQFTASPHFSLIKFETQIGEPVWFKAVGEPNVREYAITTNLARNWPEWFPVVLGVWPKWNAWFMEDAGKALLDSEPSFSLWEQAVLKLARLQLATIHDTSKFLGFGCKDRRLEVLCDELDAFFNAISIFMKQQLKSPPPVLGDDDLQSLKYYIRDLFNQLSQIGIPCSFGHGDFGPHNIVHGKRGIVFIDLAEVCITHPFFTFQYLVDCFQRMNQDRPHEAQELRDHYLRLWDQYAPRPTLIHTLKICSVLTPLSYAMSSPWNTTDVDLAHVARKCRSLIRLTHSRALELRYQSLVRLPDCYGATTST